MSRLMKSWPIAVAILATMTYAVAEDITMTTFYPSPRGVYNQLRTMGQTTLAETGGNVGIGTAAPNQKLEVNGAARFTTGAGGTFSIGGDGNTERVQAFAAAPTIRFLDTTNAYATLGMRGLSVGGAYAATAAPANGAIVEGNVGIGTTAPVAQLHVHNTGGTPAWLQLTNTVTGATGADGFSIQEDLAGDAYVWQRENRPLILGTNDTERMRILNTGNVGIGTAGPGEKLQVEGNIALGAGNALTTVPGNDLNLNVPAARSLFVKLAGATKIAMDNQGNVGIGTAAPETKLEVAGMISSSNQGRFKGWFTTGTGRAAEIGISSGVGYIYNYDRTAGTHGDFQFGDSAGGVYVKAGGNVGIGTTAPTSTLHVAGNIFATGNISVPSDGRFKTAVEPLTGALAKLDGIQAISFERNALGQALGQPGSRRELGVLAQELEQSYPELVTATGPEAYRAVDYSRLTVVLLEALKELERRDTAELDELKHQNAALEQRITALEAQRP